MKNILVLAHDDRGQESRLQAALDLGRALEGHVRLLSVIAMPPVTDDFVSLTPALLENERDLAQAHRERIEKRLGDEEVGFSFAEGAGDFAEALIRAAPLADIIVTNRLIENADNIDTLALAGTLIVKSDRPVLAVPERCTGINFRGQAMLAWDGSEQVQAALRAATPLLALASTVRIVEADDGSLDTPASEAATYLSRHGIHAEIETQPVRDCTAGFALLQRIESLRPAYLVMGGYGRSRLVEALLGGVTRRMLQESPVPLLLAR